ncbi:hypothetical protein LTR74_017770 [Friedmanniomyces endolithicus]|nr:hypothetical protein LTR74_017770 [Friedmanniomyces endolithicus]
MSFSDPFDAWPVPPQPRYPWVLDYYRHVHLPPGIATVQLSPAEGRSYIDYYMREAFSEPCLFYKALVNACAPLLAEGRVTKGMALQLRAALVQSLNYAMGDLNHALSANVLQTIGNMALHERLYGNATLAVEVHGRAYFRLLATRGGKESLRLPRIGQKMLQWTESVFSANCGLRPSELLSALAPDNVRLQHPGYDDEGDIATASHEPLVFLVVLMRYSRDWERKGQMCLEENAFAHKLSLDRPVRPKRHVKKYYTWQTRTGGCIERTTPKEPNGQS